ncbi:MAG: CotH kinase family protein [Bacteroidetes bacterium]|nr:CotH kinase family protein [Bacteroidota bacterium]
MMQRQYYFLKIILVLLMVLPKSIFGQIVINEVCTGNSSILQDEDGQYPDWIELYNPSINPVNLLNYSLSDTTWGLNKWTFPDLTIQPIGYTVVFASGKDLKTYFDHWETAVDAYGTWKYLVPVIEPDSNWRISTTYNDSFWPTGQGGIGYGDGDDNTILTPPIRSVFMRKIFNLVDTAVIPGAVLHIDYDDAFICYVNGIEVARSNIGLNGTPTPFDSLAFQEHEATLYAGGTPEAYFIDGSVFKKGNNVLAIQVHNVSLFSSDLSAIPFLSVAIEDNSSNYGPLPSWFNIGVARLHTNFKLSQLGEILTLSDDKGYIVDQINLPYHQIDHSYGRETDGAQNWAYFGTPTPDATNNGQIAYTGYAPTPVFSIDAGSYSTSISILINAFPPLATIRYTLDGSIPTSSSLLYSPPVSLSTTRVVRAKAYYTGLLPSDVVTNTYFINDSTSSSLPIVSISTDPRNLWDWMEGIYVKGPNADPNMPFFGANFWQDWEKPAHIEYFDKQRNEGFDQDVGLKIFGNYSRGFPQKSFKIIAREGYGLSTINYKLFDDKEIYNFKQFVLRNSGTDWNRIHFKDALIHDICLKNTAIDIQASQPTVVFLNGDYWGVYNIREKINEHYLNNNHGVDIDKVDLLQYEGLVMTGSNDDFYQMLFFILLNNMQDTANYNVVKGWLDIDNFIDYVSVETYSNNWDWLPNNVRFWRPQEPGGKWRYIAWDLDNGFNSFSDNILLGTINKAAWEVHAAMFNTLLQNEEFRFAFINRSADLINTIFTPQHYSQRIFQWRDSIDAEMPRHFGMWGAGNLFPFLGTNGQGTYQDWRNLNLNALNAFIVNRQVTARTQIENLFNLKRQMPVTLNIIPANAGSIQINTVEIDTFPWAGVYFDSIPVTITAIPNPGFTFSFWQSNIKLPSPYYQSNLTFVPDTNDAFTAYFFGSPDTPRLAINEINYRSYGGQETGDWIELHNYGTVSFDISGWVLKDGNDENRFTIPLNMILDPDEYLVVCEDKTQFNTIFPSITNVIGDFDFGFSTYGEAIRLYDDDNKLYLSVTYSSYSPWPSEPNGLGWTLELLDPYNDVNDPANWFAGCYGGSPGLPFTPCDTISQIFEQIQPEFDDVVLVYPNPVLDVLIVEINPRKLVNNSFSFQLFDVNGKTVYQLDNINNDEIRITNRYAPGMYFYVLRSESGYVKRGKLMFQ